MLEWYEAYADYRDTMERMERLLESVALEVTGTKTTFRGHEVDLRALAPPSLHRLARRARPGSATRPSCAPRWTSAASTRTPTRIGPSWSTTRSATSSSRASARRPIVHDYPIEISPFARTTDGDETLTERFEYFAGGMELGNAFSEINDSEEQRERFLRQSEYVQGEQEDPDYVEALSYGMPPTGGLGLGIDRLAMILTGRETIRDVILFPALRS